MGTGSGLAERADGFEMYKALHGKEISGPAGDALRGHIALTTAGNKSYHLPEKVSKEVLATWHDAFRKLMKDPKFLKKRRRSSVIIKCWSESRPPTFSIAS